MNEEDLVKTFSELLEDTDEHNIITESLHLLRIYSDEQGAADLTIGDQNLG